MQCCPEIHRLQLKLHRLPQPPLLLGHTGAEGPPADVLQHRWHCVSRHTDTFVHVEAGTGLLSAGCDGGSRRRGSTWLYCIQVRWKVTAEHPKIQSSATVFPHDITWCHQVPSDFFFLCFFYFFSWVNFLYQGNTVKKKNSEHLFLRGKEGPVQVACSLGCWFISTEH